MKAQRGAHEDYDPPPPKPLPAVGQAFGVAAGLERRGQRHPPHERRDRHACSRSRIGVPATASRWIGRGLTVPIWVGTGKFVADTLRRASCASTTGWSTPASTGRPTARTARRADGSPSRSPGSVARGGASCSTCPTADDITDVMGDAGRRRTDPRLRRVRRRPRRRRAGRAGDGRAASHRCLRPLAAGRRLRGRQRLRQHAAARGARLRARRRHRGGVGAVRPAAVVPHPQPRDPGRRLQRRLLEAIRDELADRPAERRRPTVVIYGESLGAWAGQDTFLHQGVDRASTSSASSGRCGSARRTTAGGGARSWSTGRSTCPTGSVLEVDGPEPLLGAGADERARGCGPSLVGHGNDPVALHQRRPHRPPARLAARARERTWGVPTRCAGCRPSPPSR